MKTNSLKKDQQEKERILSPISWEDAKKKLSSAELKDILRIFLKVALNTQARKKALKEMASKSTS